MERKRRVMENKVHLWKKSYSLATLWKKQPNLWKKKNTSPAILTSTPFTEVDIVLPVFNSNSSLTLL